MKERKYKILITSYLEPVFVKKISEVDPRVEVIYRPDLLAKPRYEADHVGAYFERSAADESLWKQLLSEADILFDFDRKYQRELPDISPDLRWVQGTSSGIHQLVLQNRYPERLPNTIFTSAKGVHAIPLSEFCLMSMLVFTKQLFPNLDLQRQKKWQRYATTELNSRTVLIVGVGEIGQEVARLAKAFGMITKGIKRNTSGIKAATLHLDELHGPNALDELLPGADFLVLVAPHTAETENMIGREQLDLMKRGSVLINMSRGALVDEKALIETLESGGIAGASLDVFQHEPLPQDSPLWTMPNVLVSPHSGSTSNKENERITDLFCENIKRFLADQPLINVLDTHGLK